MGPSSNNQNSTPAANTSFNSTDPSCTGKMVGPTPNTKVAVRIATNSSLPSPANFINPFTPNIVKLPTLPHHQQKPIIPSVPVNTTKNVILDYLLYLSIRARLRQATAELSENSRENAKKYAKKGHGVDAIVEGLLQAHRDQAPIISLPPELRHRLYLCQLTNLTFNRSNPAPSTTPLSSPHANLRNSQASPSSSSSPALSTTLSLSNRHKSHNHALPPGLAKYEKQFSQPITAPRCRRHRLKDCNVCNHVGTRNSGASSPYFSRKPAPGLIEAIPAFLKASAATYRSLTSPSIEEVGITQTWYNLLLDFLTQAAIECYLCDSCTSINALLEIFSYGDIDPSDYHSNGEESDEDEDPSVTADRADDYLLWQKTPDLEDFRRKKRLRRDEFLNVQGPLEKHFVALAAKYLVKQFEVDISNYCQSIMNQMETPEMLKFHSAVRHEEVPPEMYLMPGCSNGIDVFNSDDEIDSSDGDDAEEEEEEEGNRMTGVISTGQPESMIISSGDEDTPSSKKNRKRRLNNSGVTDKRRRKRKNGRGGNNNSL